MLRRHARALVRPLVPWRGKLAAGANSQVGYSLLGVVRCTIFGHMALTISVLPSDSPPRPPEGFAPALVPTKAGLHVRVRQGQAEAERAGLLHCPGGQDHQGPGLAPRATCPGWRSPGEAQRRRDGPEAGPQTSRYE